MSLFYLQLSEVHSESIAQMFRYNAWRLITLVTVNIPISCAITNSHLVVIHGFILCCGNLMSQNQRQHNVVWDRYLKSETYNTQFLHLKLNDLYFNNCICFCFEITSWTWYWILFTIKHNKNVSVISAHHSGVSPAVHTPSGLLKKDTLYWKAHLRFDLASPLARTNNHHLQTRSS